MRHDAFNSKGKWGDGEKTVERIISSESDDKTVFPLGRLLAREPSKLTIARTLSCRRKLLRPCNGGSPRNNNSSHTSSAASRGGGRCAWAFLPHDDVVPKNPFRFGSSFMHFS